MKDIKHRLEDNTDHRSEYDKFLDSLGMGPTKPPKEEEPSDAATENDEENEDDEGIIMLYLLHVTVRMYVCMYDCA